MVEFTMNHKSFRKEEDRRPLPLVPCAKFSLGRIFNTSRKWFSTLLASGYFSFQKALGKFDSDNFLVLINKSIPFNFTVSWTPVTGIGQNENIQDEQEYLDKMNSCGIDLVIATEPRFQRVKYLQKIFLTNFTKQNLLKDGRKKIHFFLSQEFVDHGSHGVKFPVGILPFTLVNDEEVSIYTY